MKKGENMKPDVPYIQRLKERVKDAEPLIEAILNRCTKQLRGPHVFPTYLTRMAQEYAEKYEINKEE